MKIKKFEIAISAAFFCLAIIFVIFACLPAILSNKYAIVLHFPLWLCVLLLFAFSAFWIVIGIFAIKKQRKAGFVIIIFTAALFFICIFLVPSFKSGITFIQSGVTEISLIITSVLCLYWSLSLFCFDNRVCGIVLLNISFACIAVLIYYIFKYSFFDFTDFLQYKTDDEINLLFETHKSFHNSQLSTIYQQRFLFIYENIKEISSNAVSPNVLWLEKNIEYFDGGFFLNFENFIEKINYIN